MEADLQVRVPGEGRDPEPRAHFQLYPQSSSGLTRGSSCPAACTAQERSSGQTRGWRCPI